MSSIKVYTTTELYDDDEDFDEFYKEMLTYVVLKKDYDKLQAKLKIATEALEKYKEIAWRTGNSISLEDSMAAATALKQLEET
jgi:hypothetical protein